MNWILLISYLNTTDVKLQEFKSKDECEGFISLHLEKIKSEDNFKDVKCFEGNRLKSDKFFRF